ncbi:uncharacterized protein BJ171DRAFT_490143 [Polychytrium aggregatum]|uniref:uncharacterized protein n=1 Tax=Polychytrium aggregatum TaxID=110093 RepID=UPI0022FEB3E6|nr:uncharacterized protein BJ171DRAFT_490143 [Polychytrium aggregatum]KAI9208070.1 hypothetical protein BJ171DRAFT_490143 [Polychytrium aggregatum]
MSRLIVKNLPKHITQERFREHFAAKGEVTDAKLMYTREGRFRQFGYIGYKNEKDAKKAAQYFNDTFIDTSKLQVEIAKTIGDATLERPWSRYSQGSSANEKKKNEELLAQKRKEEREIRIAAQRQQAEQDLVKKKALIQDLYADQEDDKLREFLQVMQPRATSKTWANDDIVGAAAEKQAKKQQKKEKIQAMVGIVANRKAGGEGMVLTKTHVKFGNDSDDEYEDLPAQEDEPKPTPAVQNDDAKLEEDEPIQEKTVAHDTGVSDMDYFKSKMRCFDDDDDMDDDGFGKQNDDPGNAEAESPPKSQSSALNEAATSSSSSKSVPATGFTPAPPSMAARLPPVAEPLISESVSSSMEIIADTGRLFIRNLAYTCTQDDVQKLFEKFGPLSEVHISMDKQTNKSKGYGFVLYLIPEHGIRAYESLNGKIFQGRILEIVGGKEKPQAKDEQIDMSAPGAFKKKRELEKKKTAGSDFSWNSLFMNTDAVIESMANKLNIKKSEILDPQSENMAVRVALAETNVINDTKQYLEDEGVSLDAFERGRKVRSDAIILVKNIPASTERAELVELFGRFGSLGRVVLPPAKTIALVEFLEQNEAKAAFRHLAYTKFKNLPLYLEWAPMGSFTKAYDPQEAAERQKAAQASKTAKGEAKVAIMEELTTSKQEKEDVEADAGMPVTTLFVKNLNFETTEAKLEEAFRGVGGLAKVRVATKPDPKNPKGTRLSMGFGFVEFYNKNDALRAIKSMQGFTLDGHALQLKVSNAASRGQSDSSGKRRGDDANLEANGTKLVVRNIPFEATKKEIQALFTNFGSVKSVRIPKKFDGSHRGFGFVDFLTKQEARAAFEALSATHLYGRHLVIEWADKDAEDVEELRTKTKKGFTKDSGKNKRRRIEVDEEGNMVRSQGAGDSDDDDEAPGFL